MQAKMNACNVVKWIPIVGQIAMILKAIQHNEGKVSETNRRVTQLKIAYEE